MRKKQGIQTTFSQLEVLEKHAKMKWQRLHAYFMRRVPLSCTKLVWHNQWRSTPVFMIFLNAVAAGTQANDCFKMEFQTQEDLIAIGCRSYYDFERRFNDLAEAWKNDIHIEVMLDQQCDNSIQGAVVRFYAVDFETKVDLAKAA